MIDSYKINVDLKTKNFITSPLIITQYDRNIDVEVSLYDGGSPYVIQSSETLRVELSLSGGIAVILSGDDISNINSNKFTFTIRREITLNSGKGYFSIAVVDAATGITTRKGSCRQYIEVLSNSIDEDTTEPTLITTAKEALDTSIGEAETVKTSLDNSLSDTQTVINGLEIGGRNYLLNTELKEDTTNWILHNSVIRTTDKTTPAGNYCFYDKVKNLTADAWKGVQQDVANIEVGGTYTASCQIYIDSSITLDSAIIFQCEGKNAAGTRTQIHKATIDSTVKDKWQKVSTTFSVESTTTTLKVYAFVTRNGAFYIGDFKLEKGNRVSDWTPSPEDSDNKFNTVTSKINTIDSKITTTKSELQSLIDSTALATKKALYPVGSLYFNATKEANPSQLLGFGTWERIAQGKTLIGVDTKDTDFSIVGKTGGSKTKTLGIEHMPQNLYVDAEITNGSNNKWVGETQLSNWCNRISWHRNNASQESVSIVQPYITVYIWKRTA